LLFQLKTTKCKRRPRETSGNNTKERRMRRRSGWGSTGLPKQTRSCYWRKAHVIGECDSCECASIDTEPGRRGGRRWRGGRREARGARGATGGEGGEGGDGLRLKVGVVENHRAAHTACCGQPKTTIGGDISPNRRPNGLHGRTRRTVLLECALIIQSDLEAARGGATCCGRTSRGGRLEQVRPEARGTGRRWPGLVRTSWPLDIGTSGVDCLELGVGRQWSKASRPGRRAPCWYPPPYCIRSPRHGGIGSHDRRGPAERRTVRFCV
jgi:hypothetical protein